MVRARRLSLVGVRKPVGALRPSLEVFPTVRLVVWRLCPSVCGVVRSGVRVARKARASALVAVPSSWCNLVAGETVTGARWPGGADGVDDGGGRDDGGGGGRSSGAVAKVRPE